MVEEKEESDLSPQERKEKILETLEKRASEEYVTTWDDKGNAISKKKTEIAKGKKSRQAGANFELKVRKDLEQKGWIVSKWQNNVDLELKKVVQAKRKFNPFSKVMTIGTGFPDFIAFQSVGNGFYNVTGVESKLNGILSKEEKEKCAFLLNNNVFKTIWISNKNEKGAVEYLDFRERYGDKFDIK